MKITIRKLFLSKSILIALILFCSLGWNSVVLSQTTIDTVYLSPPVPTTNDSIIVHIKGWKHDRVKLMCTTFQIFDSEIEVFFHYNWCGGWEDQLPFHDSAKIGCLLPMTYNINIKMLEDTVLYHLNCQAFDTLSIIGSASIQAIVTSIGYFVNRNAIKIHPNPANDIVNFTSLNNDLYINEIKIFNQLGDVVYFENYSINSTSLNSLDLSGLISSMYFVQIALSNNEILFYKLIKQ